jgi:hypothetical protein
MIGGPDSSSEGRRSGDGEREEENVSLVGESLVSSSSEEGNEVGVSMRLSSNRMERTYCVLDVSLDWA